MGARPDGPGVKLSTTERAAACMNLRLCGAPGRTEKEKKRNKLKLIENNIRCSIFGVRRVEHKKVASERNIVPAICRGRPLLRF